MSKCVEGLGWRMEVEVPGWSFGKGENPMLHARVDRAEAFEVVVVAKVKSPSLLHIEIPRGGRELYWGLINARERIAVRDVVSGRTVIFPMEANRPEVRKAAKRCSEITRPLGSAAP